MSVVNSGVSRPKFTKFLHDVERTSIVYTSVNASISFAILLFMVECTSQEGVSKSFLNGTSAHFRLFSAIKGGQKESKNVSQNKSK